MIYACDIAYQVELPSSTKLPHQGLGLVIGPEAIIGENCTIYQKAQRIMAKTMPLQQSATM